MKLTEIIAALGGELIGDDREVACLAPLAGAGEGEITFLANPKYRKDLDASGASCVIVREDMQAAAARAGRSLIVAANPYLYFARVAALLNPAPVAIGGVHASAVVDETACVAASAEIGANVVVGARAVVGERCRLLPGTVLGDDVTIGDDTTLYANVTVYHGCVIGARVGIHSGTVIGADGFGLAWDKDHWFKIPQTGRVLIEDDVEIGANTTIDRGALADTVIRRGAKIDNLVQIAHNCEIGEHTAIAGCTGIAGSTRVGARCTLGGAVMMVGHIEIADGTHIGGGTLVSKSIKKPDNYASSYPMSTAKEWMANAVHLRHLDALAGRVKSLEKRLAAEPAPTTPQQGKEQ